MRYRLGIDLGTNSLGWVALELNDSGRPVRIAAAGSRIFSDGRDPKSGASLAVDRRAARAMRRRRDRFKQRQAALIKYLTLAGLFPSDKAARESLALLDPFELRARALHDMLPLHHVGRALFHLNQRRGFKSNRKADRGKNDEEGKVRVGVIRLYEQMREAGATTLGEYLHGRRASATDLNAIPGVRTRLRAGGDDETADGYDFYPDRQMLVDEFEDIWEAQEPHHPDVLTPSNRKRFHEIIFNQRPLRQPKIGKCTLLGNEDRLPKAHPLFQQRRLLEELNALKIEAGPPLTLQQRDGLYLNLKYKRKATYESLRRVLKVDPDTRFNKESDNRREMKGDEVAAELSAKARFGKRWAHLAPDMQWEIISRVRDQETDKDEAELRAWLQDVHHLTPEQAQAVAGARLPEGYGRFGLTATTELIEVLRNDVIVYSDAVKKAGLGHHSDFRDGEALDRLPYYGEVLERHIMPGTGDTSDPDEMRIGRLTNPTVHIGLNQLRRIVNRLIERYGPPAEIAVELARELKLNDERKKEIKALNKKNRDAAAQRSRKLVAIKKPDTGANRARLKLWEDLNPGNVLDRRCVYSGRQISIDMLFSDAVDIDHILPFSATWDDSGDNQVLCLREANRLKRNRTPYEAASDFRATFGPDADWNAITGRVARMARGKRWRFEPEAMSRFDAQGGFLARQLVDTQYLSRLAREYLSSLYPERGEGSSHVWVSPGRLTEMVRRKLGLNDLLLDDNIGGGADQRKNRRDHRHHAIDAFVIAIVDRALLNRIARASGTEGEDGRERIIVPEPWDGFRDELRRVLRSVVVSHRADHGTVTARGNGATAGRLHNDTAYGITGEKDAKGNDIVVHRVPLTALKKAADIEGVRDPDLRAALLAWTNGHEGKDFDERLLKFPHLGPEQFRNIRRLRIIEPLSVIAIRDKNGRAYKGYKGDSNYRYDAWELKDGKWVAEVVSMFDAHHSEWTSAIRRDNPTARKVLSLHQDDLLAVERDGQDRKLMRVVKFGQNGQVTLAEPHEAGDLKRRDALPSDVDPFKYFSPTAGGLKRVKARQVRIDELGRIWDPGPRSQSQARS